MIRRSARLTVTLGLMATLASLGEGQVSGRAVAQEARQEQREADRDPLASAIGHLPSPYRNDERCESDEAANGPDICAQWTAANAARRSAELAWWAIFWVVVSVLVGGLSVVGTLWAAWAATRAASAAQETAKTMIRQEAPLLYLANVRYSGQQVIFDMFNAGRTVALVYQACLGSRFSTDPPSESDFRRFTAASIPIKPEKMEMAGNITTEFTTMEMHDRFRAGEVHFWHYGVVRYRTVFDDKVEVRFCRVSRKNGPWSDEPEAYNYTKKIT